MRALRRERGASAVLVGLLLVPMIAALAIALDVGALYVERAQLQNGADAAALAVATDCADDDGCGSSSAIAATFAAANANDGSAATLAPTFPTPTTVTVRASTLEPDGSTAIPHPFAALIGVDATTVHAEATAEWGSPGAGSVVPLALSYCDFADATFGVRILVRYDQNKPCSGPDGKPIMGGFGWLDQVSGQCEAHIDLSDATVGSAPGNSPPKNCDAMFSTLEDTTILIPVYKCSKDPNDRDCSNGINGQKGEFVIWAFAAFHVTGWKFTGNGNNIMNNPDPLAPSCTGNCRGVQGYFVDWVDVDSVDWELGGPDAGVTIVRLIN